MLRKAIYITAALLFSFSATRATPPLAPGKPAGIKRAQSERVTGAIAIGALAVIAIGGYALSANRYRLPGSTTATTSTQP